MHMIHKYKLFVYGTLRKGNMANGLLCDARLLRSDVALYGYELGFSPEGYPMAFECPGRYIVGEIYEVDPAVLQKTDDYEEVESGMYSRYFDVANQVFLYLGNPAFASREHPATHGA